MASPWCTTAVSCSAPAKRCSSAMRARLSAAHDAAEQAHSHQLNASIYSVLPASRRMQPRDWAVLTLIVALHGAALGVLWVSPPTPAALGAPPELMAALIAPAPPAAAPP